MSVSATYLDHNASAPLLPEARDAVVAARNNLPIAPTTLANLAGQAPTLPEPWPEIPRDLFADLRGFTRMAEGRLPYDVVFVLNQYFKAMGVAIEQQGGRIDKFIGDGIMALFGLESSPEAACLEALAAARAMASIAVPASSRSPVSVRTS